MDAFTGIAIGHQIGQARKAQNRSATTAWKWKHYAEELEEDLEKAEHRIARLEAMVAGQKAQLEALLETHPNTPLRDKTSIRWKDPKKNGAFKTQLVLIFEKAYDAIARKNGLDPLKIRID